MNKKFKYNLKLELSAYHIRMIDRFLLNENFMMYMFHKSYRKAEYYHSFGTRIKRGIINNIKLSFYQLKMNYWATKTGFRIGYGVFGWGLHFMHPGDIIVNAYARVGKNCFIYPQTLIGQTQEGCAAVIGDNVSICSGSRIIGARHIGNNVVIAPNAVVTHDVPDDAIVVGVPAHVLRYRHPNEAR